MKFRTLKYIIKEGILNTYKNILMSAASLGIMTATLLVLGIFLLLVFNMDHMLSTLKEKPVIKVFLDYELDESQAAEVQEVILTHSLIEDVKLVTKKEALEKIITIIDKENKGIGEGIDESLMQYSFIIKPYNNEDSSIIAEDLRKLDRVEKVTYFHDAIEFFMTIQNWVRIVSSILVIVLITVSVFIISNTIKLTVYARRKEINIMKYVGATDSFIRWPFFIEGFIIGITGAVFAFLIVRYPYMWLSGPIKTTLGSLGGNIINVIDFKDVQFQILLIYALISTAVGAIGSFISIKKHLHV
jgi:cell division transport system permease protein